jgi:hypothetical protein
MRGEPVDPATSIGTSDGPMKKNGRHGKVKVSLFYPPEVPFDIMVASGGMNLYCDL